VRKLCAKCKKEVTMHPEALRELALGGEESFEIYEAVGCTSCSGTGYSGRLGLYEVMPISEEIREMILNRCSSGEIKAQAVKEGMLSLRSDGIVKLRDGVTSLEEVLRETTSK
jgi:type IV pilus assembly protein PilB